MASAAMLQTIETPRSVSQVARVAVKIGDDYHTLESTVTLPPGASDAEIAEAVETGTRIYTAQQAAMNALITALRAAVPAATPTPPTTRQLNAVGTLQNQLSVATIAAVYKEFEIPGPQPTTKAQASALIDRFKAIINGVADDPAAVPAGESAQAQPAEEVTEDLPF